jgi:tyrosine-protein kinase Etk/Wzc
MAQLENAKLELKVTDEPAVESGEPEVFQFPELLIILVKRKFFILKFVGMATVLAVIFALLLRNTYTANAKIMPPQQNQSMSAMAMLSQLGPLASLAGQGLGLRSPSDIYVGMLRSRTVADALIDRFSLMSVYKEKRRADARRVLEDRTLIVAGKDGIISITVDDSKAFWFSGARSIDLSRQRAADLANGYVEELEKLTKTLAVTEASKRRAFFERETRMAMDDLANAEQALKQTQEQTGLIMLDPQSRAMIESLSSLRAQVAAKEVQVQAMRSFATPENPDLVRAEQELAALRDQQAKLELGHGKRSIADLPIENVPAAGLEYIRKFREVKYRETLFELLAKQFEAAKIDEARDALIVQQLDIAVPPEKKSGPLRAVIVVGAALLSLLLSMMAGFFMERLEKAKEDSQFSARFHLFRFYLRGRQKTER